MHQLLKHLYTDTISSIDSVIWSNSNIGSNTTTNKKPNEYDPDCVRHFFCSEYKL